VVLGRNLDWGLADELENIAYEAYYYQNNKLVFISQGFAGFVGIMNGVKLGKFSFSINQRLNSMKIEDKLSYILNGYINPFFLLFEVLLEANTYDEALKAIMVTKIDSPCFYIISGIKKNEGAIISRGVNSVDDSNYLDVDKGKWFLVQGNMELTKPDKKTTLTSDKINNLSKSYISYKILMEAVLTQQPTFVQTMTVYSTIQSANNEFITRYRNSKA